MTNDTNGDLDGLLLDAVQELRLSSADADLPPDLNSEVLRQFTTESSAAALLPANVSDDRIRKRSRGMFFARVSSVVAAAALAIGFFSNWDGASDADSLFAQVANRLAAVRSLTCRVQFIEDSRVENADGEFGDKLTYLAPSLYRFERLNGLVEIIDADSDTMVTVDHTAKESLTITGNMAKTMAAASPAHLVELVREHLSPARADGDNIVEIESRTIDGLRTIGVRSTLNGQILEAWCDPGQHLPLLIRVQFTIPGVASPESPDVKMWRVLSDFRYDVDPDPELFSLTTPDGYKSLQMESPVVDLSPTGLDDFIALLKKCATVNDSLFPVSLKLNDNEGSPMAIMKRYAAGFDKQFDNATDAEKAELMKKVTEFGSLLGRSQAFLLKLRKENDLQYFGGAKLNDAERPLFWYSPAADGHYKVVYADLSVHEVKKEHLPDKPIVPEIERTAVHDVVKALGPKNVVRVNTPRFELPPHAVKQFARLQEIRETGRQQQVEYLVLAHMPEFIENSISWEQFKKSGPVVVDPKSVPDRSPDSERLKFLTEFPNLKGLDVAHLYLTHKDLDIIGSCRKLERLSLSGVQVLETSARRLVGDDLKRFGALQHLQRLDLSQSNFVGGLMHLSRCSSLHTLYLSSFEHLNDRSVAELKVLPHLESLVLSPVYNVNSPEKCVSDHGLRSLQELPKLKNLFVGWHGKSTMPVDKLRELLPKVNVVPPR